MNQDDIEEWCDEHLTDLYNPGLFDDEEATADTWEAVEQVANDTILDFLEDEDEREDIREALLDAAAEWFRNQRTLEIEALNPVPEAAIRKLMNRPQTSQHSGDWYAERRNRLTASEFANILDGRRGALLRSKIDPAQPGHSGPNLAPVAICQEDGEMVATSWGHRFEPIVRDIYELEFAGVGTVCDTLGRFQHPTTPWLSASPDGLVLKGPLAGRLVEIKSPKSRQPGDFVPIDYYVQMQLQMEVCDLDAVDFIEAQFQQRKVANASAQDWLDASAAAWKGGIRVYGVSLDRPDTWIYRYSKVVEDTEDITFPQLPDGLVMLDDVIWWLTGWFPRTVLRSHTWWSEVGWPAAELFWAQVESGRLLQPDEEAYDTKITHVKGGWIGSS